MADYLSNLLVRLKATDVTGTPANNAPIATVTPTVGPALPAAQGTAQNQFPRYRTNQFLGNKPGIRFGNGQESDGFGQAFKTTALSNPAGSYTYVFVTKFDSASPSGVIADWRSSVTGNSDRILLLSNTNTTGLGFYTGGFNSTGVDIANTTAHVLVFRFDADTGKTTLFVDGTKSYDGAGTYAAKTLHADSEFIIGGSTDPNNQGILSILGEFRFYNEAVSDAGISGMSGALRSEYIESANPASALGVTTGSLADVGIAKTINLSTVGDLTAGKPVTLSDGGKGGTFNPTSPTLPAGSNSSTTATYTPAQGGDITITASATGLTPATSSIKVRPAQQTIAVNALPGYSSPDFYRNGSAYLQTWCSGGYRKERFTGTSYSLLVNASLFGSLLKPTLRVWVDNLDPYDVVLSGNGASETLVLASARSSGTHSIRYEIVRTQQDGDRWTGNSNTFRIVGVQIDAGSALSAPVSVFPQAAAWWSDSTIEGIEAVSPDSVYAGTDGTVTYAKLVAAQMGVELAQFGNGHGSFAGGAAQGVPSVVGAWRYKQNGVLLDYNTLGYIFMGMGANGSLDPVALKAWMEEVRAAYSHLVIVIVMPFDGSRLSNRANVTAGYNAYVAAHPSDTRVALVDGGTAWDAVCGNGAYSYDGLHYRTAGYQQLFTIAQTQTANLPTPGLVDEPDPDSDPTPTIISVTIDPPGPVTLAAGETQQFDATVAGTGEFNPAKTWIKLSGVGTMDDDGLASAPISESTVDRQGIFKCTSVADPTKFDTVTINIPGVPVVPPPSGSFIPTVLLGRGLVLEMQRLTAGDGPVYLAYYAEVALPEGATVNLLMRQGSDVYPFAGEVRFGVDGLLRALVDEVPESGDYQVQWEVSGVAYPHGYPIKLSVAPSLEIV